MRLISRTNYRLEPRASLPDTRHASTGHGVDGGYGGIPRVYPGVYGRVVYPGCSIAHHGFRWYTQGVV